MHFFRGSPEKCDTVLDVLHHPFVHKTIIDVYNQCNHSRLPYKTKIRNIGDLIISMFANDEIFLDFLDKLRKRYQRYRNHGSFSQEQIFALLTVLHYCEDVCRLLPIRTLEGINRRLCDILDYEQGDTDNTQSRRKRILKSGKLLLDAEGYEILHFLPESMILERVHLNNTNDALPICAIIPEDNHTSSQDDPESYVIMLKSGTPIISPEKTWVQLGNLECLSSIDNELYFQTTYDEYVFDKKGKVLVDSEDNNIQSIETVTCIDNEDLCGVTSAKYEDMYYIYGKSKKVMKGKINDMEIGNVTMIDPERVYEYKGVTYYSSNIDGSYALIDIRGNILVGEDSIPAVAVINGMIIFPQNESAQNT